MAITVEGLPFGGGKPSPGYNPIVYYVSSTNVLLNDFRYIAEVKSANTSTVLFTKKVAPRPEDNFGVFRLGRLLSDYLTHQDITTTELTDAANCYVDYEIDLKEEYSQIYTWTAYTQSTGATPPYTINTSLLFNSDVPFAPNDQIVVNQSDGGQEQPLLEGVLTVIEVLETNEVVVNRKWNVIAPNIPGGGSTITGEVYYADGTKFTSSALTTVTDKVAWNGALKHDEILDYVSTDYIPPVLGSIDGNEGQWLSSAPYTGLTVNLDQHLLLNFISNNQSSGVLNYVVIENDSGDSARRLKNFSGNFITPINCGPGNLTQSEYTATTGSLPIVSSDTKWYTVHLTDSAGQQKSQKYKFFVNNDCYKYNTKNLMFLDRLGSIGSFAFYYKDEETQNIERGNVRKILGDLNKSTDRWTFDPQDRGEETHYITRSSSIELTTAWLTEEESEYFQELIASPRVWLQDQNNTDRHYPVIVETNQSVFKKRVNNKNIRYTIRVRTANRDAINW